MFDGLKALAKRHPRLMVLALFTGGLAMAALAVLVWYAFSTRDVRINDRSGSAYEGARLEGPAPDFRLVDHKGIAVALADFRGKVVVLAFMDSRCDETCPLTAQELRAAYAGLGESGVQVVFLGINVNVNFARPEDMAAFTSRYELDDIPTWHFLTGTPDQLSPVWGAYSIAVIPPEEPGEDDFDHTPGVFIIDREGNQRWYVSIPMQGDTTTVWSGPPLRQLLLSHIRDLLG